jgi:hypothetical protein
MFNALQNDYSIIYYKNANKQYIKCYSHNKTGALHRVFSGHRRSAPPGPGETQKHQEEVRAKPVRAHALDTNAKGSWLTRRAPPRRAAMARQDRKGSLDQETTKARFKSGFLRLMRRAMLLIFSASVSI